MHAVQGETYAASAPGSLMWMGEHAVLRGFWSMVGSVNQRITVHIQPRTDSRIHLASALGEEEFERDELTVIPPHTFLRAALQSTQEHLPHGCQMNVISPMRHTLGLGTSAAVTVAALAALDHWRGIPIDHRALFLRAVDIIRTVQGVGSGADVAASVYGGLIAYRADPLKIEPLHAHHPFALFYSGYKMPTAEVIAHVEQESRKRSALFNGFFYEIGECVRDGIDAVCRDDWTALGRCMDINQALMQALGVSDATLTGLVERLRKCPGILGAKISGAGRGDCVIGLGHATVSLDPFEPIPCRLDTEGVRLEES